MQYWLIKTEPNTDSIDDLKKDNMKEDGPISLYGYDIGRTYIIENVLSV